VGVAIEVKPMVKKKLKLVTKIKTQITELNANLSKRSPIPEMGVARVTGKAAEGGVAEMMLKMVMITVKLNQVLEYLCLTFWATKFREVRVSKRLMTGLKSQMTEMTGTTGMIETGINVIGVRGPIGLTGLEMIMTVIMNERVKAEMIGMTGTTTETMIEMTVAIVPTGMTEMVGTIGMTGTIGKTETTGTAAEMTGPEMKLKTEEITNDLKLLIIKASVATGTTEMTGTTGMIVRTNLQDSKKMFNSKSMGVWPNIEVPEDPEVSGVNPGAGRKVGQVIVISVSGATVPVLNPSNEIITEVKLTIIKVIIQVSINTTKKLFQALPPP